MNGLVTNEVLAAEIRHAVRRQGLTWDEIHDRGGPSPATMTKLVKGESVGISLATCRKLDTAFGWPQGTARGLVLGLDPEEAGHGNAAPIVITTDEAGRQVEATGPTVEHVLDLVRQARAALDQIEREIDGD